jgi:branched-chain amino acid aminotransferase
MKKSCDELSNFKTTSSLLYVLAAIHKKESGFDESIILNVKGNVADAIYANVFIVKDTKIYTPPLSEAGVDGVMRKQILRIAYKKGYRAIEKPLEVTDLQEADEIFLTNAIKGIVWVNLFGGKNYSHPIASELLNKLNELIG